MEEHFWVAPETKVVDQLIAQLQDAEETFVNDGANFDIELREKVAECARQSKLSESLKEQVLLSTGFESKISTQTLKALQALIALQEKDETLVGNEIAYTEMFLGICQKRLRQPDVALRTLRASLSRLQQSDQPDCSALVEALCTISEIYRQKGSTEPSKTCIKQAFRVLPFAQGQVEIHCRVLRELAAAMAARGHQRAAIRAYKRFLRLRSELRQLPQPSTVEVLINLAMSHHAMHELELAENCLVRAGQLYHELETKNDALLVEILEKLAGILRQQGEFTQSDLLSERAHQLTVRAEGLSGHAVLGTMPERAAYQVLIGDTEGARKLYRQMLAKLETQRERRVVDRLPILARMYLMTNETSAVQRATLSADVEECVRLFFGGFDTPVIDGLRRLSRIYFLLGKARESADLQKLAEQLGAETLRLSW